MTQNVLHNGLSSPAEILRGLRFDADLSSVANCLKQEGILINSPIFLANNGGEATFDGANSYIEYPLLGEFARMPNFSFVLDFVMEEPQTNVYFFNSTASDYFLHWTKDGDLELQLGGTSIGTYAWTPVYGTRYVIVGAGVSGNTTLWINGVAVISASAAVWAPTGPVLISLGADIVGAWRFKGTISQFKIFDQILEVQEAQDFYDHATYTVRNRTDHDFLCDAAHHDPANKLALDASSAGDDATLGDGAGTGEPTKDSEGYVFDGVDDHFSNLTDPVGTYTVSILKKVSGVYSVTHENDLTTWNLIIASGGFTGTLLGLRTYPFILTQIQKNDEEIEFYRGINRV